MTLDEYTREIDVACRQLKERMVYLLEKGIESNLDGAIMISIVQHTIQKVMAED